METTNWTVGPGGVLLLNGSKAPLIKGVVYSPTPIGGNYEFEPHGDYYTGGPKAPSYHQWWYWWVSDITAMAEAGVNSLRTYSWFMWMPNADNMRLAKQGERSMPPLERDHTPFLDECHSNGISVLMGVGWNPDDFPLKPANLTNGFKEFYIENCRALAKKYGKHPAVLGLVLGNEVDNAATFADDHYGHYLEIMNGCADAARAGFEGNKIILPALHDNPFAYGNEDRDGNIVMRKHVQRDLSKSFTATGINTYRGPNGILPKEYKDFLIDGQKIERPLLITEWGSPHTVRVDGKPYETPPGPPTGAHGDWVRACWKQFSDSASFPFLAGGYYFEWTDEWWKAPQLPEGRQRGQHNFNPDSSRNGAFPGGYNDEAWYGVMGVKVAENRDPYIYWDNNANTPVTPDERYKRGTYHVLQELFTK